MRKWFAFVLLAVISWLGGLGQEARAGVTVDVLFQDETGSALTITEGDAGPGCSFGGRYDGSVSAGRCMDVVMMTTDEWIGFGTSVTYSSSNGLALASVYEWRGVEVEPGKSCFPPAGVVDKGGILQSFECIVLPPSNPPVVSPGTYNLGTIIWNTSGTTRGSETIAAYMDPVFDGFTAIINGNIVDASASVVVRSALLTIVPEPGTAALLGLGLVGLTLAKRRSTRHTRR